MTTYFVTRHPGARAWAQRQGIEVDFLIGHPQMRGKELSCEDMERLGTRIEGYRMECVGHEQSH
jgi:hypothetical protein